MDILDEVGVNLQVRFFELIFLYTNTDSFNIFTFLLYKVDIEKCSQSSNN